MKTLVLRQPWASLVLEGKKTVELRTWTTTHRGPVLIVAGKGVDRKDSARLGRDVDPAGVALCIVDVVDVRSATDVDADAAGCAPDVGREFAWVLANPRAVRPIAIKGRLGLYELSAEALGLPSGTSRASGMAVLLA
jgi:hypothetical protein